MKYFYRKNPKTENGASLAEYAFLLLLIALVVFASIVPFGQTVSSFFSSVPAMFGG
jgi:Flp pilus assembly pilin Flp